MTTATRRPLPTQAQQRRVVLGPVLALVLLGTCGLLVLIALFAQVGSGGVVVGTICALLPVGPVVATFLWVDRWEPEPPRLLLLAFLWGACFATLAALFLNSTATLLADMVLGKNGGDLLGLVVVAPVVEEAMKGAFIVGLLVFRRREFDGIVDGIVYAGLVAAGFAFTENILYLGRAFVETDMAGQPASVLGVLFLRGVISPFAHPLFTSMTGIAAGLVAANRNAGTRVAGVALGYLAAVVLHGMWNGSAAFGALGFLTVYGVVMLPLFIGLIVLIVWQRRREQRTVADQLPGFAQSGWIAPSEVPLLASLAGRRGWRAAVRRRSGRDAARAVAEYQVAVTELAFLRARIARGSVSESGRYWHDELLRELFAARRRAIGVPEALTAAWLRPPPPGWQPPPAVWQPPPTPPYGWAPPSPAWPRHPGNPPHSGPRYADSPPHPGSQRPSAPGRPPAPPPPYRP